MQQHLPPNSGSKYNFLFYHNITDRKANPEKGTLVSKAQVDKVIALLLWQKTWQKWNQHKLRPIVSWCFAYISRKATSMQTYLIT